MAVAVVDVLVPSQTQQGGQSKRSPMTMRSLAKEIRFDAVISRSHGRSSEVTEAAIEDGTSINDHVILAPRELTIDAIVSDHPIGAAATSTPNPDVVVTDTRSIVAAALLEELWATKALLTIVTPIRPYENKVITRLD